MLNGIGYKQQLNDFSKNRACSFYVLIIALWSKQKLGASAYFFVSCTKIIVELQILISLVWFKANKCSFHIFDHRYIIEGINIGLQMFKTWRIYLFIFLQCCVKLFCIYSVFLSYNLADLNWLKEQSSSFRYLWIWHIKSFQQSIWHLSLLDQTENQVYWVSQYHTSSNH